ncbi:MAG: hypothetical protein Q9P01_10845 [Anaerolineae bacterium]|nr:hypothetical protein [Anaerolineae bacterium]
MTRHRIRLILFILISTWISTLWLERSFFDESAQWMALSVRRVPLFAVTLLIYAAFINNIPKKLRQQQYDSRSLLAHLTELYSRRTLARSAKLGYLFSDRKLPPGHSGAHQTISSRRPLVSLILAFVAPPAVCQLFY